MYVFKYIYIYIKYISIYIYIVCIYIYIYYYYYYYYYYYICIYFVYIYILCIYIYYVYIYIYIYVFIYIYSYRHIYIYILLYIIIYMNLIKDPICQSICTMLAPRLRSLEAWPAANPWQRRLLRRWRHLSRSPSDPRRSGGISMENVLPLQGGWVNILMYMIFSRSHCFIFCVL